MHDYTLYIAAAYTVALSLLMLNGIAAFWGHHKCMQKRKVYENNKLNNR